MTETIIYTATLSFATKPTDTLSSQPFSGFLEQPFSFRRSILGGNFIGAYTTGDGELEINNTDASYDYLIQSYAVDGRDMIVKAGRSTDSYNSFFTVFKGTALNWNIDETGVHITLRDYSYKLSVPAQPNIYAGFDGHNGVAVGGAGGGADLKGKRIPRVFGYVQNIQPPLEYSPGLVYQVNDGPIYAIQAVYDRGVALTPAGDIPNYLTFYVTAPSAGTYVTCLGYGLFKLGSTPSGTVTCDVQGDALNGVFVSTTGSIIRRLLTTTNTTLVDPTDLYTPSFDAMEILQPANVGYWLGPDETLTVADVVANLMNGVGGWGGFRREGLFELGIFRSPTLTAAEIAANQVLVAQTKMLLNFDENSVAALTNSPKDSSIYNRSSISVIGPPTVGPDSHAKPGFGGIAYFNNLIFGGGSPDQLYWWYFDKDTTLTPAGDFTIDVWWWGNGSSNQSPIYIQSLTFVTLQVYNVGTTWFVRASSDNATYDIALDLVIGTTSFITWHHIAVVRSGSQYLFFLDGVLSLTINDNRPIYPIASGYVIVGVYVWGFMDDYRFTVDRARWTTNFTPPASSAIVNPSSSVGVPVALYDRTNIFDIKREPLPSGLSPPPYRQRVAYQRAWTTQTDLAGAVSAARKAFLAEPYRLAEASDATITTNHPFAPDPPPVQAYFADAADAQTEANRRLTLYGSSTAALYRLRVNQSALHRNLGEIIKVTYPRWSLDSGKLLTIVEINENIANKQFEIIAYG